MVPLPTRFADVQSTLLSIGRLTGIVGLGLYATSLVLHVRTSFLKRFLDIGQIPSLHHDLGSWAFILLLIHPITLALRLATIDPYVAAKFLLPVDNFANFVGLAALFIMMGSIVVTYYYKKNHALWLWVHRLMLVAYFGAFIHLLFVNSDTSQSLGLKYYLVALMAAGIGAFISQRLTKRAKKLGLARGVRI